MITLSQEQQEEIKKDLAFMETYYSSDEREGYSKQRISNDVGNITKAIIEGKKIITNKNFYVG